MDDKELDKIYNEVISESTPEATDPISKLLQESYDESLTMTPANTITGYNTDIGNSIYDEGYNTSLHAMDLNEYRAQNQGWAVQALAGVGRTATKFATEIARMPGTATAAAVAGAAEVITGGEFQSLEYITNNAWMRSIDAIQEYVNEDVLPVYVRESVRTGNLFDNLISPEFWATEGADGIGFMLSMLAPGKVIGALKLGKFVTGGIGKTAKGVEMLRKLDKAASTVGLQNAESAVEIGTSTLFNTMFEASAEAGSAMKGIEQKPGESDAEFQERKGNVGRNVFVSNMGILLVPNLLMNKALFGKLKSEEVIQRFARNEGRIINKVASKTGKEKVKDAAGALVLNTAGEGFWEEGSQMTVENYFKEHEDVDFEKILAEYFETLGSVDGLKAITLGGLFGSTASVVGQYRQEKANVKQADRIADALNKGIDIFEKTQGGIYKVDKDGNTMLDEAGKPIPDMGALKDLAQAQEILELKNRKLDETLRRIEEGDSGAIFEAEQLYHELQNEVALSYAKAGDEGIALLKEQLEGSAIFAQGLEEFNTLKEKDGLATRSKEDTINKIISYAQEIKKDNDLFTNYGNSIINPKTTKENKQHVGEFRNRLTNSYLKDRSKLRFISEKIDELETLRANTLSRLMKENNTEAENLDTNSILKSIDKDIAHVKKTREGVKEFLDGILTPKNVNAKFQEFLLQKEKLNEIEKVFQEQEKTQKVEDKEKTAGAKVKADKEKEEQEEKEIKTAKKEVSKIFSSIKKDYEDAYDNKNGENKGKVNKETGETEFVTSYRSGDAEAKLRELIPEIPANVANLRVQKIIDKEGRETYRIIGTRSFKLDITNYEQAPVSTKEAPQKPVVDDTANNDEEYNPQDNHDTVKKVEEGSIQAETGIKPSGNKDNLDNKHVKVAESPNLALTSANYKEFKESPRDKTGEKVTFGIGDPGLNKKAEEAISLYNQYIYDGRPLNKEDRNTLLYFLPIRAVFNEFTYTAVPFQSDKPNSTVIFGKTVELRTNILKLAINEKIPLNQIASTIEFQYPGKIQNEFDTNGKPAQNSVLELPQFDNNVDKVELVYVDRNGIYNDATKNPDKDLVAYKINDKNKGGIFVKLKAANGKIIPIKLNLRRVNKDEANAVIAIVEKLLNPKVKMSYNKTKMSAIPDFEELLNTFEDDITAFGYTKKDISVGQFLSNIIFEGNDVKNMFKVSGSTLTYGSNTIKFAEFEAKKADIANWLINNKNRNVRIDKLANNAYKKHVLSTKILSTDIKLGEPSFQGNTRIYINPKLQNPIAETTTSSSDQRIDKINKERNEKLSDYTKSIVEVNKMPNSILKRFLMQANQAIIAIKDNGGQPLLDFLNNNRSTIYDSTAEDERLKLKQNTLIADEAIQKGLAPNWSVNDLRSAIKLYNSFLSNQEQINARYDAKIAALTTQPVTPKVETPVVEAPTVEAPVAQAPVEQAPQEAPSANKQTITYKNNQYEVDINNGKIINVKSGKEIKGTSAVGKNVLDKVDWGEKDAIIPVTKKMREAVERMVRSSKSPGIGKYGHYEDRQIITDSGIGKAQFDALYAEIEAKYNASKAPAVKATANAIVPVPQKLMDSIRNMAAVPESEWSEADKKAIKDSGMGGAQFKTLLIKASGNVAVTFAFDNFVQGTVPKQPVKENNINKILPGQKKVVPSQKEEINDKVKGKLEANRKKQIGGKLNKFKNKINQANKDSDTNANTKC